LSARAKSDRMTSWCQLDIPLLDEWNAVLSVVIPITTADVVLRPGPRQTDVSEAAARLRVGQLALGRLHITGAAPAAGGVKSHFAGARAKVGRSATLIRCRSEVERHVAAGAVNRARGIVSGNAVHEATNGV